MSAVHISGTARRSDIEGLRAVAVSLVVLYHVKVAMFSGGYVGVDVFFVVSGFLITQILVDEINVSGRIRLHDFWARRIRRIMPMASLVVVLTVIASYLFLEKGRGPELIPVALGSLGFCANLVLFKTTEDYLSGVALPSPLQHYWSLGVEEQFYVVWPLLLLLVARLARARWRLWVGVVCAVLLVLSLEESIRITPIDRGGGYFLPQTRAWEILAGSLLAILGPAALERVPRLVAALVGWVGLGALLYAAVTFDDETNFPGHLALVPVLGTVGVLIAGEVAWGPVGILRLAPLQRIGLWSFSLYLWHWPVLVIAESQFGVLSNIEKVVAVAVCVALSAASFALIEHPIQWNKYLSARPWRTFVLGFSMLALLLGGGTVLMATRPTPVNAPTFAAPRNLAEARRAAEAAAAEAQQASSTTVPGVPVTAPPVTPVNAFLVGDSTLAELRWFEQSPISLQGFTYTLDAEACRRLAYTGCLGRENRIPKSAATVVKNFNGPLDVVVLVGGYHGRTSSIRDELQKFAAAVSAKHAKLVIFTFKETLRFPVAGSHGTRSVYSDFNDVVRAMAAEGSLGDVTIADWNLFSYAQPSWFRPDGMHTTITGTLALGWFISDTLAALYGNACPFDNRYPCTVPAIADPTTDWLAMFQLVYTDQHCYEDGVHRTRVCELDRRMS